MTPREEEEEPEEPEEEEGGRSGAVAVMLDVVVVVVVFASEFLFCFGIPAAASFSADPPGSTMIPAARAA